MIRYIFKIFSKSIVKGPIYFLFSFVLLLIPLNVGQKNLDKVHTTIVIYSDVKIEDVEYSGSKQLWDTNYYETISSIHHNIHVLGEKSFMSSNTNEDPREVVFSDIITNNGNLDEDKIKPNFFNNFDLWIDPDKSDLLRYELNYHKDQIDNVNELAEIFFLSFKNLVQHNIKASTTNKIKNIERNEKILIDEKLDILNNYQLSNDSTNLQINIDYNFKSGMSNPKILQLDAQKFFVNINNEKLDGFFRITMVSKDYDWFKSKQYYLGYIFIIIISILISMFFTMNKIKKKL